METDNPVAVDTWFWSLDAGRAETDRLAALLSPDEAARAARFFKPIDRDRWTVSRARTRLLLADALRVSPEIVVFGQESGGRPFIAGGAERAPFFNISHSAGLGALAISFAAQVGVDVEAVRPVEDAEIAWALSPAEREELALAAPDLRLETFFRFWTLKESLMKGMGLGAALPLHDFDIRLDGLRLARLAGFPGETDRWKFAETVPATGFRGAVTARTDGRALTARWLRAD